MKIRIDKEDVEKVKARMLAEKISETKDVNATVSDDEVLEAIKSFKYRDCYENATIHISNDELKKLICDESATLRVYGDLSGTVSFANGWNNEISFHNIKEDSIIKKTVKAGEKLIDALLRNLDIEIEIVDERRKQRVLNNLEKIYRKHDYIYRDDINEVKNKILNNEIALDDAENYLLQRRRENIRKCYEENIKNEEGAVKMLEEMQMTKQAEIHKEYIKILEKEMQFKLDNYELLSLEDVEQYNKTSIYDYDDYINIETIEKIYKFYNKYKDDITDIIIAEEGRDTFVYALCGERDSDRAIRVLIAEF